MVQPAGHIVYAIHEYAIPGSGFLPLKAGDIIHVEEADESGWWLGINLRDHKGVFPSTYTLPYTFPRPQDELLHDARLMLLAREFGVDATSGAPLPLHTLPSTEPPARLPATAVLCSQLSDDVVLREEARNKVMALLEKLLELQDAHSVEQAAEARRRAADAKQKEEAQQAVRRAAEAIRARLDDVLAKKAERLKSGLVPSCEWYAGLNRVVTAPAVGRLSPDAAWRATLKEVKEVVRHQEEDLTLLSSSCAREEAGFAAATAALQTRVEWRDAGVASMLAYWADAAQTAKSAYTAAKVMRDAAAEACEREAAELCLRLEERRERFAAATETYRLVKQEAEGIAQALRRKEELDALSQQIAQIDAALAVHRVM